MKPTEAGKAAQKKPAVQILLIDDSAIVLRFVADLLGKQGWKVEMASNLAEALVLFTKCRPQVVLADFVLEQGMTGLRVLQAIFAASKGSAHANDQSPDRPLSAILTNGGLTEADMKLASEMGVPVFQKPKRGEEKDFGNTIGAWMSKQGVC